MNSRTQWIFSALAVPLVLLAGYGAAGLGQAPPSSSRQEESGAAPGSVAEYPSMTALRKVEAADAYDLTWTVTGSPLIVVAPHGGAIEPRTSEIASAIAGAEHTQCQFKGMLPAGQNFPRLHVTSTNWDVEECLILIRQRTHALSVHGMAGSDKTVHIGGRDTATGAELATALRAAGFTVVQPATGDVAGTLPENFVNKDADGAGVQLELTNALRMELFPTKDAPPSSRGQAFVDAVRGVYS
ncbi:poly-gamma-glutamate hydrolase family protein [Micromonospora coxensis]|uniref:poly-gamma-glutamate hydrolase family protein n=1 Tax=Micromonospora coxensis TaxID=356852 RepID=UPI003422F5D5